MLLTDKRKNTYYPTLIFKAFLKKPLSANFESNFNQAIITWGKESCLDISLTIPRFSHA